MNYITACQGDCQGFEGVFCKNFCDFSRFLCPIVSYSVACHKMLEYKGGRPPAPQDKPSPLPLTGRGDTGGRALCADELLHGGVWCAPPALFSTKGGTSRRRRRATRFAAHLRLNVFENVLFAGDPLRNAQIQSSLNLFLSMPHRGRRKKKFSEIYTHSDYSFANSTGRGTSPAVPVRPSSRVRAPPFPPRYSTRRYPPPASA